MSKEIDLSISRSFGLEKQLKAAVAEFAKKQEQITLTLRNRKTTEVRKHRGEVSAVETWLAQGTQTAETNFAEKQAHVTQRGESRRKHIESARQGSASDLQKMARRAKERWMERLQMRHFLATQNQPIDLKTLEEKFTQFTAHLEEQRVALVHLQHRVRRGFFGFPSWWSLLRQEPVAPAESEGYLLLSEHLEKKLEMTSKYFSVFRAFWIPHLFSYLPIFITIPLLLGAGAAVGFLYPSDRALLIEYGIAALVAIVGLIVLQVRGSGKADASANILSTSLREATGLYNACAAATKKEYEIEYRRVQQEYKDTFEEIDTQWNQADEVERTFGEKKQIKVAAQIPRLFERQEKLVAAALKKNESLHAARIAEINREAESKLAQITAAHNEETTAYTAQETIYTNELETLWQQQVIPPYEAIQTMTAEAEKYAQPWSTEFLQRWTPPSDFPSTARFGSLNLDLEALAASLSVVSLPPLPGPQQVSIPLSLNFPESGSLLFETSDSGQSDVIQTLNNTILRVLSITPPGKLSFTIIDPIGLGQNFAGLMHLADFEESLINRRIWTQSDQIEARLEELNEHIEKVIQMYLRNEYATITEYNAQAGSVAEKYHFLVIADFPANFSETAIKRLQSIAVSGPRCGVFTLIHWDNRHPKPEGFVSAELEKNSICIRRQKNTWLLGKEAPAPETTLSFDRPPDPALQLSLVHKIGESSIDANRVEVPFTQIIPKPAEMWTLDSASEVRIPIGRTGATKLQYLSLGKGTRQHALFAGKTGSGKSTLFHVIITNLALAYSPDQVEFYLIDFKKGVEFKCYASHHLPHARVVAIESDREFGLSVLRRVDEELKRRGDIFRKLGVQDIPGYIREGGKEPMPRTLLIIDEFQEFFVQDDQIAQTASLLFDRIVRQGRAFGIHVLLGSQTLGGAYTLARATLGQMVVRVALQCNEADAYLIMDENNSAPRLLSRPGEGIYNDSAGAPEGNSPFQVVWLSDEERDVWLDKVHQLAEQKHDTHPGPIVFEGNAPADIRENVLLRTLLEKTPVALPAAARCWLGAPNSIKGPTEAVFSRQSGSNLLIVGQREDAIATMLGVSLKALSAQYPQGTVKFFLFHASPQTGEPDVLEKIATDIPQGVTIVQTNNLADVMNELSAELASRLAEGTKNAPEIFVIINGLQKFKKLRNEDDFSFSSDAETASPATQLNALLTEGGSQGIHLIVTVDTFNNVNRFLNRKALTEFEMRVVFQMSANDSASLIDTPQASTLGLYRALFYNEHDGHLETFRPYAPPDAEWLNDTGRVIHS